MTGNVTRSRTRVNQARFWTRSNPARFWTRSNPVRSRTRSNPARSRTRVIQPAGREESGLFHSREAWIPGYSDPLLVYVLSPLLPYSS